MFPRGGTSGLRFRLAPVAMDVTLICTGPCVVVGAFRSDLSVCCCRSRPGCRSWP